MKPKTKRTIYATLIAVPCVAFAAYLAIVLVISMWDSLKNIEPGCSERACKPGWSGDCHCSTDTRIEVLGDGTVLCRCARDAGGEQ